jgi:hypothetical protein
MTRRALRRSSSDWVLAQNRYTQYVDFVFDSSGCRRKTNVVPQKGKEALRMLAGSIVLSTAILQLFLATACRLSLRYRLVLSLFPCVYYILTAPMISS